jgi:hypothetical protein
MLLERRVDGMVLICAEITDVRSEQCHYEQLIERRARLVFAHGPFTFARIPTRRSPTACSARA